MLAKEQCLIPVDGVLQECYVIRTTLSLFDQGLKERRDTGVGCYRRRVADIYFG